ncbi:MAG: alpha/beta hydrolase [SAR202 cluster bacterium]|nr:alpha/beta hydrolase [SAR202 cluster bacterium]
MPLTAEHLLPHPGVQSRWVRLPNGANCHYMTAGDTGPAVVLLHGGIQGSSGLAGWGRWMMPALAQAGFRVYAPDQPGFGLSDTRPEFRPRHGVLDHVEFVKQFVNVMELDQFHLSGNSMGATNTAHFVVDYPERVLSYILIATYLQPELGLDPDGSKRAKLGGITIPPWDGTAEGMGRMMELIIVRKEGISADLKEMRAYMGNLQKESYGEFLKSRERIQADPNLKQKWMLKNRLENLTISALYLYGQLDVLIPVAAGHEQEDYLKNMQFFYPANTGHQGQTDTPELHNKVYIEFFKTGKVSRKTAEEAGISKRRPELKHLVEQGAVAAG